MKASIIVLVVSVFYVDYGSTLSDKRNNHCAITGSCNVLTCALMNTTTNEILIKEQQN